MNRAALALASGCLFASFATLAAGALSAPSGLVCPAQPAGPAQPSSYAGQTLVNVNFAWRDLRNADFSGATLDGVIFIGANLSGASFKNARFTNSLNPDGAVSLPTDFSEAKLGSACFVYANFEATAAPTYLTNADLTCTDFSGTDLSRGNAIFGTAPLVVPGSSCRTRFQWTTLSCEFIDAWSQLDLGNASLGSCASGPMSTALVGRDFTGARMDGFNFYQANLAGVTFNQTQLHGANLAYANLQGASLNGVQAGVQPGAGSALSPVNLTGAYMVGVDLTDADLRSATLAGAHIYGGTALNGGVNFVRTRLDSADLSGALMPGAVFSGSLTNTVFDCVTKTSPVTGKPVADCTVLVGAVFNGADLSFAKFNSVYLQGADFSKANSVKGTSLSNSAVSTMGGSWGYTEQDGTPVTFGYGATALGGIGSGSGAFCPSNEASPCTGTKLTPVNGGPYPPVPKCVPVGPKFDNCLPPKPG